MKILNKNNVIYLLIFVFFLIIYYFCPITGDDWGNYLNHSDGILKTAIDMYFNFEGRFISRILLTFLCYYKNLWAVLNAISSVFIIYFGLNIFKNKESEKRNSYILFFSILLIGNSMFRQVFIWVTGSITYLFPTVLALAYFYFLNNEKCKRIWQYILFTIINFIGTMFVENMAVVFVLANVLFLIYEFYKLKKINKYLVINLAVSIIGAAIMLLSPGSKMRAMSEVEFQSLNIFGKAIYNIPNFIYYTFIRNNWLLLLVVAILSVLVYQKEKNKRLKFIQIFGLTIFPVLTMLAYGIKIINKIIPMSSLYQVSSAILNPNNIFAIIYFILFLILCLYIIFKYSKNNIQNLLFLLIGLTSNVAMLLAPIWGERTAFFTVIMFYVVLLNILNELPINKLVDKILNKYFKFIVLLISLVYIFVYWNTFIAFKDREKLIKQQIEDNAEVIEVIELPNYTLWTPNPDGEDIDDYHRGRFKKYYGIEDKEIKFIKGNFRYMILYM